MNANAAAPLPSGTHVRTLLLFDLVESTSIVESLGDARAAALFAESASRARTLLEACQGREIDQTDGFLLMFDRPADAASFALRLHDDLRDQSRHAPATLLARCGIHLGEVVIQQHDAAAIARGAKPVQIEGRAKHLVARVMSAALPGQTLMTRAAFDLARRAEIDAPSDGHDITWMAHGLYQLKGIEEPTEIFEVGLPERAPLQAPAHSEKARPLHDSEDDDVIEGWRPASGLEVPGRAGWRFERRLGTGAFGESWLARHDQSRDRRAFKFCFDRARLRALRRETMMLRLIRDELGERPDIARLREARLDESPYYLESEYSDGGDLQDWADTRGGLETVPFQTRLNLVERVARAAAAAHSIGIVHKDIKPANILIDETQGGGIQPRLADFGISALDESHLESTTRDAALLDDHPESRATSEPMYLPPESARTPTATIQGDIYALGVLLYQVIVGDLNRALAHGWERDVDDPILRGDIAACVEGEPDRRLASARELADRLRDLAERRRSHRRRSLVRLGAVASALLLVVTAAALYLGISQYTLRTRAENEQQRATTEAAQARAMNAFLTDMFRSLNSWEQGSRDARISELLDHAIATVDARFSSSPELHASTLTLLGEVNKILGRYDVAETLLQDAVEIQDDDPDRFGDGFARSLHELGAVRYWLGNIEDARALTERALDIRRAAWNTRPNDTESARRVALSVNQLAACHNALGNTAEAGHAFEEALEIRRTLAASADDASRDMLRRDLANALNNRGTWHRRQGHYDDARADFSQSFDIYRELAAGSPDHPAIAGLRGNIGKCNLMLGDLDKATEAFHDAVSLKREIFGDDHPRLAISLHDLGIALLRDRDHQAAASALEEALTIRRAMLPMSDRRTALTATFLALCHEMLDDSDTASTLRIDSYPTLVNAQDTLAAEDRAHLEWLVDQYDDLGRSDDARRYRLLVSTDD